MKLLKKKKPLAFKICGRLKRGVAVAMAALLMITAPLPGLSSVSFADAPLKPVKLPSNGGGLTTAYSTHASDGSTGQVQGTFDIEGIEDPDLVGAPAPYTGNRDRAVSTTYQNRGYATFVQPYKYGGMQNYGKEEKFDFNYYTPTKPMLDNGGVKTFDNTGIQLQIKVHPSEDKKWVLVDYVVHNTKDAANKVQVGTSADIKLGGFSKDDGLPPSANPADSSKLEVNKRGFHMVNSSTKQTFECVLNDPELGLTPPTTTWVGKQDDKDFYRYADTQHTVQGVDSGLAYSWTINLAPLQTVTKRVAFGVKGSSYYVSASGDDSASGDYAGPFKTIQRAIQKIESTNPGSKATYIYLQSDYEMTKPVVIPSGYNINIESTDYNRDGSAGKKIYTVTRGPDLAAAPMFQASGASLHVGKVVLDGNKTAADSSQPIISADSGIIGITSGTTLQNNKVTTADMGSAINITGTGNLSIDYGDITGNETVDRGAVYFNSSGTFEMDGGITVNGNTDAGGNKANVYLPEGKYITVNGSLGDDSKIGVTSARTPDLTVGGTPDKAGQEVKVAVPLAKSLVDKNPPPFIKNFFADKGILDNTGLHIAAGTPKLPEAGVNNDRNAVLRKDAKVISFKTETRAGDDPMANPLVINPIPFGPGDPVTTPKAPDTVAGYTLFETKIEQGTGALLQVVPPGETDAGKITGTMPAQDVTVTYVYRQLKSQIAFDTNGGIPGTVNTMTGPIGSKVPAMPKVSKEGYEFLGWSKQNDGPASPLFAWPSVYPTPAQEIMLYAIFKPNPAVKYDYTKEYTDSTGKILFHTETTPKAWSVEDGVTAEPIKVPGYTWDPASSYTTPSTFPDGSATPVGEFDAATGNFTGHMPAKALTVHFGYKPDPSPEAGLFPLTIHYQSNNGTILHDPDGPDNHKAGTAVEAIPKHFDHYKISGYRFDKGLTGGTTPDGGWVGGVQKPPAKENGYQWNDTMPNQEVELTYLYEGDGETTSSFNITEHYVDDTAAVTDPALKNIMTTGPKANLVDVPVNGVYKTPYGYTEVPDSRQITATDKTSGAAVPSNIGFGAGSDSDKWSGAMPAGDVDITYHHTRDTSKWADITYKPGKNGTLSGGTSPDLTANGDGSYKASVLLQGADDTLKTAYTWDMVKKKGLAPNAAPGNFYQLEGWFVDTGGNGIRDKDEPLITDTQTFVGTTTLTASFTKIKSQWMDVHFTAEKGTYASGDVTQNVPRTMNWGGIQGSLPSYTAWPHYEDDGWYTKSGDAYTKISDNATVLTQGQTYIHRFIPDSKDTHTVTRNYINGKGNIVFKTAADSGKYKIEDPLTAAAVPPVTVPGYTFDQAHSNTVPVQYPFVPGSPANIGIFGADGGFTGKMPGEDLTVNYKYAVDTAKTFKLTIQYVTEKGITIHGETSDDYNAEHSIEKVPLAIPGYTPSGFEFTKGNADKNLQKPVQGEPNPNDGYKWSSQMPNQDVTLVYKYKGDAATPHKLTEKYVDTNASDPILRSLKEDSSKYPSAAADTPVSGEYQQPYGYQLVPPIGIEYKVQPAPTGADIKVSGTDQNKWSGHMSPSDVDIIYSNTRIPDKWANITYISGEHGSLSSAGQSSDLKAVSGKPGKYTAGVLKSDTTPEGNKAAYTLQMIRDKKLMPVPVPEDASLYKFAGWVEDTNHNGIIDKDDPTPITDDTRNFAQDTTLIASFEKQSGAWMDIHFKAVNGNLKKGDKESLNIPQGKTWGEIQSSLPTYTPWDNYKAGGWYDASGNLMASGTKLTPDGTYTLRFIPDDGKTFPCKVIYTNKNDTFTFKEVDLGPKSIDAVVTATKADVPGYTWSLADSKAEPGVYTNPSDPASTPHSTGTFSADGTFTGGRMPGQAFTVHYRYVPKPPDPTHPEKDKFALTVRYQSKKGATLKDTDTAYLSPEETINKPSPAIDHYTCTSFTLEPQLENDGQHWPLTTVPVKAGNGFTWNAPMPNQPVTLTYYYEGDKDPASKFNVTERYMDMTGVTDKKDAKPIAPPTVVKKDIPVDEKVSGAYVQPYGYLPGEFVISVDKPGVLTDLHFGTDAAKNQWSGEMPASNVTITYYNTRNLNPPPGPEKPQWATMTYQKTGQGTIGATASPDLTTTDGGMTYKAQMLIPDGTPQGNAGAYTWKTLKDKNLVPTATPKNSFYTFAGWYIDKDGNGTLKPENFLGKGDKDDTAAANSTTFAGDTKLIASFTEIPEKWIDITFGVEKGSLAPGNIKSEKMHTELGTTWGQIQKDLPDYQPWTHYVEDGWYAKTGTDETPVYTPVNPAAALAQSGVYIHRFKPSTAVKDQFDYVVDHSSATDSGFVFKTTDPVKYNIEDPVGAAKIDVPGYTWDKAASYAEPASYNDPAGNTVSTGSFDDNGVFTGHMPGDKLTVHYKYKLLAPTDPDYKTYTLKVQYWSENQVPLSGEHTEPGKLPQDPLHTEPFPGGITGYTCIRADIVDGKTHTDTIIPAQGQPDAATFIWDSKMPNQDVTVRYIYKAKADIASQHTITQRYLDSGAADPKLKDLIPPDVSKKIVADTPVSGTYTPPYGYTRDSTVITYDPADPAGANIRFDAKKNQWGGNMPPADVEITYNHSRIQDSWAAITYKAGENGHLSAAGKADDLTPADSQAGVYKTSVLKDDGIHAAEAYSFGTMGTKLLVPDPVPDNPTLYHFKGWVDETGAKVAPATTFTKDTTLTAVFEKKTGEWIDINFDARNGSLNAGAIHGLSIPKTDTWGDITDQLPDYTPWANYKKDEAGKGGWYHGTTKMTPGLGLTGGETYTAVSVPDTAPDKTYAYKVVYTNETGDFTFKETEPQNFPVDTPLTPSKIAVAGYDWDKGKSYADPAAYTKPGEPGSPSHSTGSFNDAGGFIGTMPGEPLTVHFIYVPKKPDPQDPDKDKYKFGLKVQYQSENGATLKKAFEDKLAVEDEIHQPAPDIAHYTCYDYRVDAGKTMGDGLQILKTEPVKTADGKYTWDAKMPNQPVTLTYLYKGDEDPTSKFKVTEKYMDVTDPANPKLISSNVTQSDIPVDQKVVGDYVQPYGYLPATFNITVDTEGVLKDLAFGTTDDTKNHWSGFMPASDVTVTYNNTRDLHPVGPDKPKWATVTYQKTGNGTLTRKDADSPDLTTPDKGVTYNAPILIPDQTPEGQAGADTWKTLKKKLLVPTAVPESEFYTFAGWYIDPDGSGVLKPENMLEDGQGTELPAADTPFTKDTKLIASFVETEGKWIDVTFKADKGSHVSGDEKQHIKLGTTWGQNAPKRPVYSPWNHYVEDGWYLQGKDGGPDLPTGDDPDLPLVGGGTYIHRFKPSAQEADQFAYKVVYRSSDDPAIIFKTVDGGKHPIDWDGAAAKPIEIPGYTLDTDSKKPNTDPPQYAFDGTTPEDFGSFNPDTWDYTASRMPGQDLTVYYNYKVKEATDPTAQPYKLTVKYQSVSGIPLDEENTPAPRDLMPEAPTGDQVSPVITGYTCTGYEFETGNKADPEHGISAVKNVPVLNGAQYHWTDKMPNQDVTLIYKYTGDQNLTYTLTEKYIDTGSQDQQEIAGTTKTTDWHPDDPVSGDYKAPFGYQSDPDHSFTVTPQGKGIAFDTATHWTGRMPAENVTITYYNQRITDNPSDPDHPYWGDITYLPGKNGTLTAGADMSPDVTPEAGGYKASILLDKEGEPRPEAYTWGMIRTKKLLPTPEADKHYMFDGWFEDIDGSHEKDAGEPTYPDSNTDPTTFTKPTTLTASFAEEQGDWITINLAAEKGYFNNDNPYTDSKTMHITKDQTWDGIKGYLAGSKPWPNYVEKGWYDGETEMTDGMHLAEGHTYTYRCVANPEAKFDYTVKYVSDSGMVFKETTQAASYLVNEEVSAAPITIAGYHVISGVTDPESFQFDPTVTHEDPIGTFEPDTYKFTGHMPAGNLTLTYKYAKNEHQTYNLTVRYQTDDGTGKPSGINIYPPTEPTPYNLEGLFTVKPAPADAVKGYSYSDMVVTHGNDPEDAQGNPLTQVGEPKPNQDHEWTGNMPNQDVIITYLYKGDISKTYTVKVRYLDQDAPEGFQDIIPAKTIGSYTVNEEIGPGSYEAPYGYVRAGQEIRLDPDDWSGDPTITFDGEGNWSGHMPPRNVEIIYKNTRIQENWGTITYKLGTQNLGGLTGEGKYVTPDGNDYTARILVGDKSQGYTLKEIEDRKLTPGDAGKSMYYKLAGWFVDTDGDGKMDGNETLVPPDQTFNGDTTLTAHFEETPGMWYDIHFKGENAGLNDKTKEHLHIQKDKTWGELKKESLLPAYTAEVNYKVDDWYDGTTKMTDDMSIMDGHTYTIVCYKDPDIFGTAVKTPEASGGLDGQGKGKITVFNASESSYQYILTDTDGTILMVVPQRSASQRVEFDNLYPGTRYNVYEAVRELAALPGGQIGDLGADGTKISKAAQVLTPVLDESNYQVYYDSEDTDGDKTRLTIKPADPDADYAVLDSQGQVVQIPGAQEGGWITLDKNLTFLNVPGLGYNEEYTVVARPKGRTDITAQSRQADGSTITTDPVGDLMLRNYIIKTTKGGTIVQVGELSVGDDSYMQAHKGDTVTLSADGTNEAGEPFLYWKSTIGSLGAQAADMSAREITFPMPAANLVMTAVYDHHPAPDNASVKDEVRRGNREEIALDPDVVLDKEDKLTGEKDRVLMKDNGAAVTYKVVYQKNKVTPNEIRAVKASDDYNDDHDNAFHGAWGLDVNVERYVDGRPVPPSGATPSDAKPGTPSNAGPADETPSDATPSDAKPSGSESSDAGRSDTERSKATPSDATPSDAEPMETGDEETTPYNGISYRTYIQMGKGDVDMMDYQLYEITTDDDGNMQASLVPLQGIKPDINQEDLEAEGLFTFEANAGSRYVMVYSRAYHVYFINELPLLEQPRYYDFKVRRKEAPQDSYYDYQYENIPDPKDYAEYEINIRSGAEYNYEDWSYHPNHLKRFDPSKGIKDTTRVYAYYTDNEKRVAEEREKLKAAIEDAWKLSEDPFMKRQDREDLEADILEAQAVFQQAPPEDPRMALESELKAAREKLQDLMKHYEELIKKSHDEYDQIKESGSSGGGGGGGGGGGKGVIRDPFNSIPVRDYLVGTNGNWKEVSAVPGQEREMSFILNGGMALRSMWARLKFPDKPDLSGWYHFNSKGIMDTGWFKDEAGKWYYCFKEAEGPFGKMATGWHKDAADGRWYYLDPANGAMVTGWQQIGGKWYYLDTLGANVYVYNAEKEEWTFGGNGSGHPLGSMYQNEMTPDGFKVDENGAWIQ